MCVMWPRGGTNAGADGRGAACGCRRSLRVRGAPWGASRRPRAPTRELRASIHTPAHRSKRGGEAHRARPGAAALGFAQVDRAGAGAAARHAAAPQRRARCPCGMTPLRLHGPAGENCATGVPEPRGSGGRQEPGSAHFWCPFVCQRLPGHALRARPLSARLEHLQCPRTAHRASRALVSAGACHS